MGFEFDADILLKLLLSSLLGGVIGLEREVHGRPAGFRTHLLVSLGSTLFVLTSIQFYRNYGNFSGTGPVGTDPARIAAQVVAGIGFLGAGAIIREKASIRGLTTAACLWVAAAIGVAVGAGMYLTGVIVTALAVVNLVMLKKIENLLQKDTYFKIKVWCDDLDGQIPRIEQALQSCAMEVVNVAMEKDILLRNLLYEVEIKGKSREEFRKLTDTLSLMEGVKKIRLE
jgi:putative Mg2+ transporter-C (MgtC) family protein